MKSLDMTLNVAQAAVADRIRRFVFASSNQVMGRYKDPPLNERIEPGELNTDLDHAVGTIWMAGNCAMDSTIYAVAKSSGERICRSLALQSGSRTEFVRASAGASRAKTTLRPCPAQAPRLRNPLPPITAILSRTGLSAGSDPCGCPIVTSCSLSAAHYLRRVISGLNLVS